MSNFGATSTFGAALFGGEPVPYLLFDVDAETTTLARRLMARGQTDGTSIQAVAWCVGSCGYDPLDYRAAIPVNPDAQALDSYVDLGLITHYEWPNERTACYYCALDTATANTTLGEVGIIGEIQWSPYIAEIHTFFMLAIGHFPMKAKNSSMAMVLRVTQQA